jgi:hypothetical protein
MFFHSHARERLLDRMQRLRNAAEALGIPSDAEIRELVDQARAGNARHRCFVTTYPRIDPQAGGVPGGQVGG